MLSQDQVRWTLASRVAEIFPVDETPNSTPGTCSVEELTLDIPEVPAALSPPHLSLQIPGGAFVRAEWVLVPAWLTIGVAAVLPVARNQGSTLFAWNFGELIEHSGWRGATMGGAWLVVMFAVSIALCFTACSRGRMRGLAGLTLAWVSIAGAVIAFAAGSAGGFVSALSLFLVPCAVRLMNAALDGSNSKTRLAAQPYCSVVESVVCVSTAIFASVITVAAVVFKGNLFIVSAAFVLTAGVAIAIAGIAAGSHCPRRSLTIWMSVITLTFVACAVAMEGITELFLGGPRMAMFDAIRGLSVSALAGICVYLASREVCQAHENDPSSSVDVRHRQEGNS